MNAYCIYKKIINLKVHNMHYHHSINLKNLYTTLEILLNLNFFNTIAKKYTKN